MPQRSLESVLEATLPYCMSPSVQNQHNLAIFSEDALVGTSVSKIFFFPLAHNFWLWSFVTGLEQNFFD